MSLGCHKFFISLAAHLQTKPGTITHIRCPRAGVVQPHPQTGLTPRDKAFVVECLKLLRNWSSSLRCSFDCESVRMVPWARVPILKLKLQDGPEVDISFGDAGSRAAAEFVATMVAAHPLLRPLVLVLKAMLRNVSAGDLQRLESLGVPLDHLPVICGCRGPAVYSPTLNCAVADLCFPPPLAPPTSLACMKCTSAAWAAGA